MKRILLFSVALLFVLWLLTGCTFLDRKYDVPLMGDLDRIGQANADEHSGLADQLTEAMVTFDQENEAKYRANRAALDIRFTDIRREYEEGTHAWRELGDAVETAASELAQKWIGVDFATKAQDEKIDTAITEASVALGQMVKIDGRVDMHDRDIEDNAKLIAAFGPKLESMNDKELAALAATLESQKDDIVTAKETARKAGFSGTQIAAMGSPGGVLGLLALIASIQTRRKSDKLERNALITAAPPANTAPPIA